MRFRKDDGPWQEADYRTLLMGMNIGCRAAIIYSPIDISWGWDANAKPIMGGILFDQSDSLKLGANMLTFLRFSELRICHGHSKSPKFRTTSNPMLPRATSLWSHN